MRNFKEWFIVVESKQVITDMGFPEIISQLLYKKFGKNAPLIAKWYKQYKAYGSNADKPDWWQLTTSSFGNISLADLTRLYDGTKDEESYRKAGKYMGFNLDDEVIDDYYLEEQRTELAKQIEYQLFKEEIFFRSYSIVKDIETGALKDLAPYKKLNFDDAQHKYEERAVFGQTTPIKVYPDGFKWIDVGKKCHFLGNQMNNCGSVGVMSSDPKSTIVALFGPNNKPHVMVTYSPGQNRVSGDQGAGSTAVKDKYHSYVIDLANTLGANFDADSSKSTLLGLKYLLRNKTQNIESISNDPYNELFRFSIGNNVYYTNGYTCVSHQDVQKVQQMLQQGEIKLQYTSPDNDIVKTVLARANLEWLRHQGIQYTPLNKMAG